MTSVRGEYPNSTLPVHSLPHSLKLLYFYLATLLDNVIFEQPQACLTRPAFAHELQEPNKIKLDNRDWPKVPFSPILNQEKKCSALIPRRLSQVMVGPGFL